MPPKNSKFFLPKATRRSTGKNIRKPYNKIFTGIALLLFNAILIGNLNDGFGLELPHRVIWLMTGGGSLVLIWILRKISGLDWLSPPVSYLIIFWLFHFGLIFTAAIVPELVLGGRPSWAIDWLSYAETDEAAFMSLLFISNFLLGIFLIYKKPASYIFNPSQKVSELIRAGWFLIGIGLLLAAYALSKFGASVFLGRYADFYQIHNSFSWPIIIIATGLMLQAAGGLTPRDVLLTALWAFLPLAIPVALTGTRTSVLFSAAAVVSVLHKRGLQISSKMIVLGLFLLLVMISAVRETRQYGIREALRQQTDIGMLDPLGGLVEMGGSLRPVSAVIDYSHNNDFFWGETFVFPLLRQIERFTDTRGTRYTDERFIATRINQLYGSIGFSIVAEAYINGGVSGVIIVAFIWGLVLGALLRNANSPYGLAVLAVVLIPMFINVRNSFIFVPAWVFLGLTVIKISQLFPVNVKKRD